MKKDRKLADAEILAWARLQKASARMLQAAERDLKAAGLPPLAWYDALLELHRAAPKGLRPGDLEAAMLLPQYNVSRLLDRLEEAGYAERFPHPEDKRGQMVRITEEGIGLLRRMWRVYRATIAENLADRLGEFGARKLAELLKLLL
jgi:DNA-binding MarR family transcriptional regulator